MPVYCQFFATSLLIATISAFLTTLPKLLFHNSNYQLMNESPICCNRLCKKILKMQENAQWDHELGSWKGRAPSLHVDEFKSPLYVFGYGSLIWRPGDYLSRFQSFSATATKCKRLFAQKSLDHRGNSKFPGLVLNLVRDDYLLEKGYSLEEDHKLIQGSPLDQEDNCYGLVWLVPDDEIVAVLAYLDDREKGGYSRHYIHVKLMQETPHYPAHSIIDAVVYTGLEDNPNFFLPKLSPAISHQGFSNMQDHSIVADVITGAKGLSGTNVEYLLKLQRYLEERNMSDTYINHLAAAVRMRMGTWRRKAIINNVLAAIPSTIKRKYNTDASTLKLIGCGSNEFHQLHKTHSDLETTPVEITDYVKDAFSDMPGFSHVEWIDAERHTVLAAGGSSAYLYEGRVAIWGTLTKTISANHNLDIQLSADIIVIDGVEGVALGYDTVLILLPSGWVISLGNSLNEAPSSFMLPKEAIKLRPVEKKTTLKPFQKPSASESSSDTQSSIARYEIDIIADEYLIYKPSVHVIKIALGLKIAAAITHCGGLIVWGTPNSGIIHDINIPWYPPSPADDFFVKNSTDCSSTSNTHLSKCIDVACGAYHVVVIDDEGRVYTHTDVKYMKKVQRYGSLGDSLPLRREDSDYSGRENLHASATPGQVVQRVSISEGASTSFPRTFSLASYMSNSSTGASTPTTGSNISACYLQKQQLGPSSLCMHQVLLPTDVRFVRASVGWSHTIVRGLKRCGEVVCYAWGRQDMSQYQTIDSLGEDLHNQQFYPATSEQREDASDTESLGSDDVATITSAVSQTVTTSDASSSAPTTTLGWNHGNSTSVLSSHASSTAATKSVPSKPVSALSLALKPSANASPSTDISTVSTPNPVASAAVESSADSKHGTTLSRDVAHWHRPRPLLPLPENRTFAEIWCGSEFTIAMDAETSSLWAMGWNEHGNLGCPPESSSNISAEPMNTVVHDAVLAHKISLPNIVSSWRRISTDIIPKKTPENSGIQVTVFDGSVACGGAHVICLHRPVPEGPSNDAWSSWCI